METEEKWRKDFAGNIKGRIAEAIVEQMFKRSDNSVELYFFGVEWRQLRDPCDNEINLFTRYVDFSIPQSEFKKPPDFLLIKHEGYSYELIEVKFRDSGIPFQNNCKEDDFDFLRDLQKIEDCAVKVVWVSQTDIKVVVPPYLNNEDKIVFEDVLVQQDWKIKEDVFAECLNYLRVYDLLFPRKNKK